jgi:hypothetical protein
LGGQLAKLSHSGVMLNQRIAATGGCAFGAPVRVQVVDF